MDTPSAVKKTNLLVSVIIGVYNGERYLKETVDSLLAQTYENREIIIVNDGSTDQSQTIIASYHDPRIICINRANNLGLTKSLNEGLGHAQGKYIARLDVGDVSIPSRIAEQVSFLNHHPEVGIVGSGIQIFVDNRTLKNYIYNPTHEDIKNSLLHFVNPLPHSTLMLRKSVVDQLHGYDNRFLRSQDYDLLLRALDITRLDSIPKALVRSRFDPSSLSYASSKQLIYGIAALLCAFRRRQGCQKIHNEERWKNLLVTIEKFIEHHRLDRIAIAGKYGVLARLSLSNRRWFDFFYNAFLLLAYDPLFPIQGRKYISHKIVRHLDKLLCSSF